MATIGEEAFGQCSSLVSLTCLATNVPTTSANVFTEVPVNNVTLYVPASALNAYKNANQWKAFGTILAIGDTAPETVLVTQIALSETSLSLLVGESRTFTATLLPENATNRVVAWQSSNEAVATVNAEGKVTAVSAGSATITATTTDGSNLSAQCAVTVQEPDPSVLFAGECGSGVYYSLSVDGVLTLSGSGTINFDSNNQPWKEYLRQIKIIIIPEGVTSICSYAFRDCSNLTTITLPSSLRFILDHAFVGCSGLTEIVIPEGVESIGEYAFEGLKSLQIARLPSTVKSFGKEIFRESPGKVYVKCSIPDAGWYDGPFRSSKLSEAVIEEGVDSIGSYAFNGCSFLERLTLPSTLRKISNDAFYDCSGLTELTLPSGIERIGNNAFHGCGGVVYLNCNLPDTNDGIFRDSKITRLVVGDGVTYLGQRSFYGSSQLVSMILPSSLTIIGSSAFEGCKSLAEITLPTGLRSILNHAFKNCEGFTEVVIPEGVESIGEYAFEGLKNLQIVRLPSTVKSFGKEIFRESPGKVYVKCSIPDAGWYDGPFRSSKLSEAVIEEGVDSIGSYAFNGCSFLERLTLPSTLRKISNDAFYDCSGLTELTLPSGIERIGNNAFHGCGGVVYLNCNLPDTNDGIFRDSKITRLVVGDGVTYLGQRSFYGSSQLVSVTLPASLTSIGEWTFENCRSLTDVYCYAENVPNAANNSFTASAVASTTLHVPASGMSAYRSTEPWSYFGSIVTLEGEVEPEAFAYVDGIRYSFASNYATVVAGDTQYTGKVIIPASVNYNGKSYTVTSIGENAFRNCSGLTTIVVPEAVWNIQKNAFNNCVFQTLMLKSAAPPTLAEGSLQGITGTVYVPEQGIETYQNRWSELASRIKPFEVATTNLPSNKWSRADFKVLAMAFDAEEDYGSTSDDNPKHNVVVGTPSRDANGRDWYAFDYQCDWEMRKAPINHWCNHNGDIYARRMFCYDGELPTELFLACGNDDAPCEYYLNGELIWSKPNGWFENEIYQMSSAQIALLKPGELNVLAFHVHQNWGGMYADSGLYPDLSKMNISYQCGDNLTWSLDGETGTLTISGAGYMNNYGSRDSRTEAPWGLLLNTVKHIEIESGVNSIGNCAFEGCYSVTSINIPETVTSIGSNAFRVCIGLTDVYCYSETLPSTNGNAFDGAPLETATLHVPEGAVDSYRASSPWNKFGSVVVLDDNGGGQGGESEDVSLLYGTWRWNFDTNSYILLTFSQDGTVRYQEYDKNSWQTDEIYNFTYSNNSLKLTYSDGRVKGVIEVLSLTATTLQLKGWPDGSGSTFTKQDGGEQYENVVLNGSIIGQWNIVSGSYTKYENEVQVLQQSGAQTPPYQRFAFYDNGVVEFLEYSNSNGSYHEDGNGTYTIVDNKFVYGGGDWDSFIITAFDGSNNMDVYFQTSDDNGSTVVRKVYYANLQRVTDGGDPTIAGEFQGPERIFGENLLKSSTCDDKTYTYHYDDNGFVTQINRVRADGSSKTYTISYDDDKIIVSEASGGRWVATLGSNGYAKELVEYNASGKAGDHAAFTYNADEQLTAVDYGDGDVFRLTYSDGDIIRVTEGQEATSFSYESSGQGKILNVGSVMEFDEIFDVDLDDYALLYYIGALGKPTKHLPLAGTASGMTITANWTLDDAGRATKAVFNGTSISWNWDDNGGGDEPDPTMAGEFQGAKRIFGDNLLKSVSYDSETNSHYDGTYNFHYDGNGFVTQIDRVGSSGSSTIYTITYGDKIIVNISDDTPWIATLESHGYIGKLDYYDEKGNAESVTYSYNENGQLVSVDYGGGDVFTLTYTDGDITRVTNFGKTINYQYETASQGKILNTGGVMEFGKIFSVDMENLLYYIGAFGKPTTHLPLAGIVSGMTITGDWTLDDAGRATKAVFNGSSISWNWDDNGSGQGGNEQDESAVLNGSIIGQWNIVSGTETRYENGVQVSQQGGTLTPPYDRIAFYDNGTFDFLEHNSSGEGYHEDGSGTYTIVDNKFVYGSGEWDSFIITSFDGSNSMEVVFRYRRGSSDNGYYVARAVLQRVTDGGDEVIPTDISQLDNVIYIEPVEGHPGSELTLSVKMKNNVGIQTVQFDLYLPDGVTVAKDEDGFEFIELSTKRTTARKMDSFSYNLISTNAYRILINSSLGYTFDGEDGEIALVKVNISPDMAEGDYPLILKDIVLVNTNTEGFETEYVKSILTISDYMPGDINGDGKVNAIDLNGIVNYILERRTFPFTFIVKAADLNSDSKINAIDVNAVTNMILRGASPKNRKMQAPVMVGVLEEK